MFMTLAFRMSRDRLPICQSTERTIVPVSDDNSNNCKICHLSRDAGSPNVHDLDLDIQNEPSSNVNMTIEETIAVL